MRAGEIVVLTAAILLGIFYGLPALMERRGSLWKDMAEERDMALKEAIEEVKKKDEAIRDQEQTIKTLELRTDLSALQEGIVKEREQGVLLMQQELTKLQQSILKTEERVLTSYENHEVRAQERHEKVIQAFEALADKLHQP